MNPSYEQLVNGLRRRMTMDEVISKLPGAKQIQLPDRRALFERNSIQRVQFDAPDFLDGIEQHQQNVIEVKQKEIQQEKGGTPPSSSDPSGSTATKVTTYHYNTSEPRPSSSSQSFDISGDAPNQSSNDSSRQPVTSHVAQLLNKINDQNQAADAHMTNVDDTLQKDDDDKRSAATTIARGVRKHLFKQKGNVADDIASQTTVRPANDSISDMPTDAQSTHLQRLPGMVNYSQVKYYINKSELDTLTAELKKVDMDYVWSQVAQIVGAEPEPPKTMGKKVKAEKLATNILYHDIKHLISFDESDEQVTEKEKQEREKQLESITVSSSSSSSSSPAKPKASNIRETEGKRAKSQTDSDIINERVPSIGSTKLPNPINSASMDFWKDQSPIFLRLQLAIRGIRFNDSIFEDSFVDKQGKHHTKKTKDTVQEIPGKDKTFLLKEIKKLIDSKKWVV